jgi:hypothetical protein
MTDTIERVKDATLEIISLEESMKDELKCTHTKAHGEGAEWMLACPVGCGGLTTQCTGHRRDIDAWSTKVPIVCPKCAAFYPFPLAWRPV